MRGHRIIFMVISFVIFIVTPVFSSDIVSRTLLSMIQSFIGRRYLSREDSVKPPLSIYIDEASNIIYPGIEDLFNKAGGAGVWIQAFTQSQADMEAEIGAERAKKILDNTNTKIFMRVNDVSTAEYISDYSGESRRYSPLLSLNVIQFEFFSDYLTVSGRCYYDQGSYRKGYHAGRYFKPANPRVLLFFL